MEADGRKGTERREIWGCGGEEGSAGTRKHKFLATPVADQDAMPIQFYRPQNSLIVGGSGYRSQTSCAINIIQELFRISVAFA